MVARVGKRIAYVLSVLSLFFLLWAPGVFAGTETKWIPFKNPNSEKKMEKQIYDTILAVSKRNKNDKSSRVKAIEKAFDDKNERAAKDWEDLFESYDMALRDAAGRLADAKTGKNRHETARKSLIALEKELKKQTRLYENHKKSLEQSFSEISYEVLVAGAIGEEEDKTPQELNGIITPLFWKKAVKQVNGNEIEKLTIVKNNRTVRNLIKSTSQGHCKPGDQYPGSIDYYDEEDEVEYQIFLYCIKVYPFRSNCGTPGSLSDVKADIKILSHANYAAWLDKYRRKALAGDWVVKALDRIEGANAEIELRIKRKMKKWKKQERRLKKTVTSLKQRIQRLKEEQRTNGGLSVSQARKAYDNAWADYRNHLNKRVIRLRKQDHGTKTAKDNSRTLWARLGKNTLAALQDIAGDYEENVLVQDNQLGSYKETAMTLKEKKLAFKLLYLTRRDEGNRTKYTASIGYKIALTPVLKGDRISDAADYSDEAFTNTIGMKFVYIRPGEFMMGSNKGYSDEKPVHKVRLSRGFYMQTTEVTIGHFREYLLATGNEKGVDWTDEDCPVQRNSRYSLSGNKFGKDENQPMVEVSWHGAKAFASWLSGKEQGTYRLPTEAEWEYACRAGSDTDYANGNSVDVMGWYTNNSGSKTHVVGRKKANAWGLYDMHGNVWEWCEDRKGTYPSGFVTDPKGPASGESRVLRGGSWVVNARYLRSASRINYVPGFSIGSIVFRLVFVGPSPQD